MASSKVEMASSSPFGCVLRDRNHGRESNANANANANTNDKAAAFQKNLKELVRDHLNSCISSISSSSSSSSSSDENSHSRVDQEQRNNHGSLRFMSSNINISSKNREESSSPTRQSQIVDGWGVATHAAPAPQMASTNSMERQSPETLRETSLPKSEGDSLDLPNIGASSLVQMWEARLNRSNSFNANANVNSNSNTNENASITIEQEEEEPPPSSCYSVVEVCDSLDETFESPRAIIEGTFGDWESDRTASSSHDAGDNERIRVADIIKRLSLANPAQTSSNSTSATDDNDNDHDHDHQQPTTATTAVQRLLSPRERNQASVSNHVPEQRGFSHIINLPRIRGRSSSQAEHKSFPPIITLPRIRGLSSAFDQSDKGGFSQLLSSPRLRGRQAINDLLMQMELDRQRELDTLVERRAVSTFPQRGRIQSMLRLRLLKRALAAPDQQHSHSTASELNRPQGSTIMLLRERFDTGVEHGSMTAQSGEANSRNHHGERVIDSQDLENSFMLNQLSEDNRREEVNTTEQQNTSPAWRLESYESEDPHEEASLNSDVTWQETSFEASSTLDIHEAADNAEEQEATNRQLIGTSYDWFNDISRPQEYWESRRQAWYQELDTHPRNEEIRQLLERRRVSTFLSSDFRDRMNQLMMSHLHQQTHLVGSQEEDEMGSQERMDQLMSFLRRHAHQVGNQDEEEVVEEEVYEEEESPNGGQYHDVSDYFDQATSPMQMHLPSLMSSWSSYQDHEVCDDSDQIESTSSRQRLPSQSYYQDIRQSSSSMNHPSIEMELMYDLRGHIEQLHHEMSELRKSIKSCMNMQMKLQHFIIQEVYSVRGEEKRSFNRAPRRGSCCICYEMQVDSLLYRCGHMCTCLKCAHELQWSSGKCPICRAPIVDVVRAYADS